MQIHSAKYERKYEKKEENYIWQKYDSRWLCTRINTNTQEVDALDTQIMKVGQNIL